MSGSRLSSFAVIPAAGRSIRMGRPKLLLPWGHATLMEQTLAAWRSSDVDEVVVVVCPGDTELAERIRSAGAWPVVPTAPPPEMKDSVRLGLDFVRTTFHPSLGDAWMLAPADAPLLPTLVIDLLLQRHREVGNSILVPRYRDRRGHPVLFPWTLASRVSDLRPNEGINSLVQQGPTEYVDVDDPAILTDVDTPEDYLKFRPGGQT
jgi:molybdenum cofactor cytidylyltransferase